MPWYPGSEGFITHFWDGQKWLISLTNDHLILEGRWIALNDIAEVAYWNKTEVHVPRRGLGAPNGPSYTHRAFSVTDIREHNNTVNLDNLMWKSVPENALAWTGLVNISRQFIEPRIAQRILKFLRAGEKYSIKNGGCFITLSNGGFTGRALRKRTYPWSDFDHVEVNPVFNNVTEVFSGKRGKIRVYARSGAKSRIVTEFRTDIPNAVVLSTLMPLCAAAFATRIV